MQGANSVLGQNCQIVDIFKELMDKKVYCMGISSHFISKVIYEISHPLCHKFNLSLESGIVPNQL